MKRERWKGGDFGRYLDPSTDFTPTTNDNPLSFTTSNERASHNNDRRRPRPLSRGPGVPSSRRVPRETYRKTGADVLFVYAKVLFASSDVPKVILCRNHEGRGRPREVNRRPLQSPNRDQGPVSYPY